MAQICVLETDFEPGINTFYSRLAAQALESNSVVDFGRRQIIVRHEEHNAVFPLLQQRVLTDPPNKAFRASPAAVERIGVHLGDGGHVLTPAGGRHNGTDVGRSVVI